MPKDAEKGSFSFAGILTSSRGCTMSREAERTRAKRLCYSAEIKATGGEEKEPIPWPMSQLLEPQDNQKHPVSSFQPLLLMHPWPNILGGLQGISSGRRARAPPAPPLHPPLAQRHFHRSIIRGGFYLLTYTIN